MDHFNLTQLCSQQKKAKKKNIIIFSLWKNPCLQKIEIFAGLYRKIEISGPTSEIVLIIGSNNMGTIKGQHEVPTM